MRMGGLLRLLQRLLLCLLLCLLLTAAACEGTPLAECLGSLAGCPLLPAPGDALPAACLPLPADLVEKLEDSAEDMEPETKAVHSQLEQYRCALLPCHWARQPCPGCCHLPAMWASQLALAAQTAHCHARLSPAAAACFCCPLMPLAPAAGMVLRTCCGGSAPTRSFTLCRWGISPTSTCSCQSAGWRDFAACTLCLLQHSSCLTCPPELRALSACLACLGCPLRAGKAGCHRR